jgi:glycosyltransferase involved in cell wall biosynthesis
LNGEGTRLVVEAEAGLAAPAEDAQALAETILKLYKLSPAEREKMGENARKYYQKHFNHNDLVEQLIQHFQSVCLQTKKLV